MGYIYKTAFKNLSFLRKHYLSRIIHSFKDLSYVLSFFLCFVIGLYILVLKILLVLVLLVPLNCKQIFLVLCTVLCTVLNLHRSADVMITKSFCHCRNIFSLAACSNNYWKSQWTVHCISDVSFIYTLLLLWYCVLLHFKSTL